MVGKPRTRGRIRHSDARRAERREEERGRARRRADVEDVEAVEARRQAEDVGVGGPERQVAVAHRRARHAERPHGDVVRPGEVDGQRALPRRVDVPGRVARAWAAQE